MTSYHFMLHYFNFSISIHCVPCLVTFDNFYWRILWWRWWAVDDVTLLFFTCKAVLLPSVLWHYWLGVRKSHRSVKTDWWGVGVVNCLELGADCMHMVQLMPLHPKTPSSLASFTSGWFLPFWYQLTQVVLEKRPLSECSSNSNSSNSSSYL